MSTYCKAYKLENLRKFSSWAEKAENTRKEIKIEKGKDVEIARELKDGDFLYLHEDYTVTDGIFSDRNVIFNQVTPEWQKFCKEELKFAVPTY